MKMPSSIKNSRAAAYSCLEELEIDPMTARACVLGMGHLSYCQDVPEGNHYEDEGGSYPWTAAGRPSSQVPEILD
jgi:hypothetical protein